MKYLRVDSPLSERTERLLHTINGAAIEVHRRLGPGFLESIYERALYYELTRECGLHVEQQVPISVPYREISIDGQRIDLLVDQSVIVELKTVEIILPIHTAQLLSYLRAMRLPAGLILNFKVTMMRDGIRRVINKYDLHGP
jgi:GxxExxY protein